MESELTGAVTLSLSKASCLILFELLTASYEVWRKDNPNDSSAGAMLVNAQEGSQRAALWELEGSLERTLPELFPATMLIFLRRLGDCSANESGDRAR